MALQTSSADFPSLISLSQIVTREKTDTQPAIVENSTYLWMYMDIESLQLTDNLGANLSEEGRA